MDQPILIGGLTRKRAELAGQIIATEKMLSRLREDLIHLDATLKLFDPEAKPKAIVPRARRPPPRFKAGQLAKLVLTALREANRPLTVRDLVQQIAAENQVDISTKKELTKFDYSIRSVLQRQRQGVNRKSPDDEVMTFTVD